MKKLLSLVFFLFSFTIVAEEKTYYTVGVVPQFSPQAINEIWSHLLHEVSKQAGVELRLVASPSIPEFEKKFTRGEFDFAYMNPYHLIVANREQGYIPLLKDTAKKLRGIIVVAKNSPIRFVHSLDGKTVAFPAPNALGAALIPRAEFANKFHITVKELYTKSHSSVYLNVVLGVADAGGGVEKTLARQPAEIREKLRVLYKTVAVSPHPIVAHPRINSQLRERVKQAFLSVAKSVSGKSMLAKVPLKNLGDAKLEEYLRIESLGLDAFYVRKP